MISYDLQCDQGHRFSSIFQNMGTYDQLKAAGHLVCTHCNSTNIEKAPMAPAIVQSRSGAARSPSSDYEAFARNLWASIDIQSTNVGGGFADAVRDGQSPVHGVATIEQAIELREEGYPVLPLPPRPADLIKRSDLN